MSVTLLFADGPATPVAGARADGEHLFLAPGDMNAATGWELKPEGLCREEACVPLPGDGSWVDSEGRVDLAAFAEWAGRPLVRDDAHGVWAFGESAGARSEQLLSLRAPEFTLPDLEGRMHSLSDYRGRKIFLMTWGSY